MNIVKAIKYVGGVASIIGGIVGVVAGVKDIREGSASDETKALGVSEETETEVIETQGEVVEPEETTEE